MITQERVEQIRQGGTIHGLKPYQVDWCLVTEDQCGFTGKDVLEVGGSLPRGFVLDVLKVRSWTAVEEPAFWAHTQDGVPVPATFGSFAAVGPADLSDYQVVTDGIEHLGPGLHGRFDLIYSVAALQHVLRLGPALYAMHQALRPGGQVAALASPIWSAPDGYILRPVTDAIGRVFTSGSGVVPPWAHLLWRPPEFFLEMCKRMDRAAAGEVTYEVFHSPRLNRLFPEDYDHLLRFSPFAQGRIMVQAHVTKPPPDLEEALKRLHPACRNFHLSGLRLFLARAA